MNLWSKCWARTTSFQVSLGLLLLYGTLGADSPPRVGALQDSARHAPRAERDSKSSKIVNHSGYALVEPLLVGDWIVCVLWHGEEGPLHAPPAKQGTRPALVAVNVHNGKALQLTVAAKGNAERAEIENRLPFHGTNCAVVIAPPGAPTDKTLNGRRLWKWDLQTGQVAGEVSWGPSGLLALVLDQAKCEVTARPSSGGVVDVHLRDIQSGRRINLVVDINVQLLAALDNYKNPAAQTLMPLKGGRSFILIYRTAGIDIGKQNSVIAEYVDPASVVGRRPLLRAAQIEKELGSSPDEVYPVPGSGPQSPVFGMIVESTERGWPRKDCLAIAWNSGEILRSWRFDKPVITDAVMSADGRRMALVTEAYNEQTQREEKELRMIDVAKGTELSKLDLSHHLAVSIFAFQDADHLLAASNNELWRFALSRKSTHQLLFRLDPSVPN